MLFRSCWCVVAPIDEPLSIATQSQQRHSFAPMCTFRSLPEQGHALGRDPPLAAGNLLQRQQPVFQIPDPGRVPGRRLQLQQLHVGPCSPLPTHSGLPVALCLAGSSMCHSST